MHWGDGIQLLDCVECPKFLGLDRNLFFANRKFQNLLLNYGVIADGGWVVVG